MDKHNAAMRQRIYGAIKRSKIFETFPDDRTLKFRFCEEQTKFSDKREEHFMMCEFEMTGTFTHLELDNFVSTRLSEIVGLKLYCKMMIRTISNRILLFITHIVSPTMKRRLLRTKKAQTDSGITSESEPSLGGVLDQIDKSVENLELKKKGLRTISFNGAGYLAPVIMKNDTTQTDTEITSTISAEDCTNRVIEKPTKCITTQPAKKVQCDVDHDKASQLLRKQVQLSRLSNEKTFQKMRHYLAFYSEHDDFGYKGETKLSCQVDLLREGLPIDKTDLMKLYESYLQIQGLNPDDGKKDIISLGHMIRTERTIYLSRARDACNAYFLPADRHKVKVAHHGYPSAPGRCDPEFCVIQ